MATFCVVTRYCVFCWYFKKKLKANIFYFKANAGQTPQGMSWPVNLYQRVTINHKGYYIPTHIMCVLHARVEIKCMEICVV